MDVLDLDRPVDSDIHTLADFAELLCLLTPDRYCSRDDLKDYIEDKSENILKDSLLEDIVAQLAWREGAFYKYYPFSLVEHGKVLHAPEEMTGSQRQYIFFLLCANLPFINRDFRSVLTDSFEKVSEVALRAIWPCSGIVRKFGKNTTDYSGKKHERIQKLGVDIGANPQVNKFTYRSKDSGDGGIDLAAWLDLDDHEKHNIPSALAQCACSRTDWVKKALEISCDRLGGYLCPTHRWMQVLFIPHSFRNNNGKWDVPGEVSMTVIIDRLRLINQLAEDSEVGKNANQLLDKVMEQRADLV